MKLSLASLAVAALATQVAADGWFGSGHRAVYNKWHETELERWLDDYSIPHPSAADRKDLEDLVQKNWENNVVKPYNSWDVRQLGHYITSTGHEIVKGTEKNAKALIDQITGFWTTTEETVSDAFSKVESWVFDTWTESQLKSFLDHHGIPNPSPRTRDSLLFTARSNYGAIAKKAGQSASYPGDWLYEQWSESDLKAWLDKRGIPVPQPTKRDKLIATIRRNAYLASEEAGKAYATASKSAASARQSLSDQLLESWSDSQIKEWCDKNGVKVPQGSKRNELIALARKHYASLSGDNVASSASSAYGAATSKAGNWYPQATNDAYAKVRHYYDYVLNQVGFASAEAKSSLSSASVVASKSASSASSVASVEASKSSKLASKSGSSAASVASKSAASAASVASKSGKSAYSVGSDSASSAASVASKSAESAASVASKSGKSAYSVGSSSVESAASVASSSGKSAASVASKSGKSAASVASKSGKSAASVASDSVSSAASVASKSGKSIVGEASKSVVSAGKDASRSVESAASEVSGKIEKATDWVKNEL